jgi:hypothetical protein
MTLADTANINHDRETRLRFMRIDRKTSDALREFWPVVEKALSQILEGFYTFTRTSGANQIWPSCWATSQVD